MLYCDSKSATHTHYLCEEREHVLLEINRVGFFEKYSNVLYGTDLIEAFQDAYIGEDNIVLMFSIAQYHTQCLATEISKQFIFSGLDHSSTLRLPYSAGSDIMHLAALNIPNLLISLWCATIDCKEPDDKSTWDWAVFRSTTA